MLSNAWMQTRGLCRYYKHGLQTIHAVDNIDLILPRGDFLGVVGSSGSGKSTLLNLMAGLDSPTSGQVEVEGIALNSLDRRQLAEYRARRVGIIFQTFNLMPHHTAIENVEMALYFNSTPRKDRRQKSIRILEELGLGDRLRHRPPDLSGGEQQRVAIARALVKNPEILFADEPTGNLDQDNTGQIAELLKKLNNSGLTIVLATHDEELAMNYARRIVRMDYGRLIETIPGLSEGAGK